MGRARDAGSGKHNERQFSHTEIRDPTNLDPAYI
jgi:hypothetical protein